MNDKLKSHCGNYGVYRSLDITVAMESEKLRLAWRVVRQLGQEFM